MTKKFRVMAILAVSLLILPIAASFTGCDTSNKIRIMVGMWPNGPKADVDMFKEWKRLFENDYPEYEIVDDPFTYSYTSFEARAKAKTQPTIFQTWFTEPEKLVSDGYVRDITPQLEELGWYDKMEPQMREILTFNDKVYGVPRDGYGLGLFINTRLLYNAGVLKYKKDGKVSLYDTDGVTPLYPTTFDELRIAAEAVTNMEGGKAKGFLTLSANNQGGWQFSNIAWNFGAELQKQSNGKWVANLNTAETQAALRWIYDMKHTSGVLPEGSTFTYSDWFDLIGNDKVAMCFVGSDAISMPVTNFEMNKDDIAFVPMPAGPGGLQYSLYGGTPYMFSVHASDDQVMGALRFLEYMGRSPETSAASLNSVELGHQTAARKGMPILPTIKPWSDEAYLTATKEIDERYYNVDLSNYNDFFNTINAISHSEEPYYCQDMYKLLDEAVRFILENKKGSEKDINDMVANQLAIAQSAFQIRMNNVSA